VLWCIFYENNIFFPPPPPGPPPSSMFAWRTCFARWRSFFPSQGRSLCPVAEVVALFFSSIVVSTLLSEHRTPFLSSFLSVMGSRLALDEDPFLFSPRETRNDYQLDLLFLSDLERRVAVFSGATIRELPPPLCPGPIERCRGRCPSPGVLLLQMSEPFQATTVRGQAFSFPVPVRGCRFPVVRLIPHVGTTSFSRVVNADSALFLPFRRSEGLPDRHPCLRRSLPLPVANQIYLSSSLSFFERGKGTCFPPFFPPLLAGPGSTTSDGRIWTVTTRFFPSFFLSGVKRSTSPPETVELTSPSSFFFFPSLSDVGIVLGGLLEIGSANKGVPLDQRPLFQACCRSGVFLSSLLGDHADIILTRLADFSPPFSRREEMSGRVLLSSSNSPSPPPDYQLIAS